MTFIELQCFISVATELNYSKAAKQLFLSQSAVSRHIASLEEDLGAELFDRNNHNVSLTPAGLIFLSEAKYLVERAAMARDSVHNITERKTLIVGFAEHVQIDRLSEIYQRYHDIRPDVLIHSTSIRLSLKDRVLLSTDVAFVPCERNHRSFFEKASLEYVPLHTGRPCCVVRKDHRFAGMKLVNHEDLCGETLILLDQEHSNASMDEIQLSIRRTGRNLTYYYSSSARFTLPLIEAGLGIAIMPDFTCPPSDKVVKVPFNLDFEWEYGIVYQEGLFTDRVKKFIDAAKCVHENGGTASHSN